MELLVWLRRHLMPPEEDDALRRYIVVVLAFSHIVTALSVLTYYLAVWDILKARGWYYMVVLAFGIALFILRNSLGASQTRFFLAAFVSFMFVFILSDLRQGGKYEQWTFSVCFMNILLLTKCCPLHINIAMATTIVYLLVIWAEQSFNLGLYDAVGTATPDYAGSDRASFLLALRVFVILFDFFVTRGFATSMEEQKQRALKGIETAQAVTKALEAFDLEEASHSLASLHDVDLKEAFKGLIANLHMYRPYLPDVLFSATPSQTSLFRSTHPGKDGGTVALVFTDIQSSTALWERFPLAMSRALRIHNDTIRRCIHEANGYEVKTVGDSFMVAFDTVLDAATFCLSAQEQLYAAEWPAEMQTHPLCQRVDGAWNGLRVRMGLNCGEMEVQINPLTGRADYFGTEVNKAARLEGVALGGTAAFPDILDEVRSQLPQDGVVHLLGRKTLKGLEQECMVWLLVPRSLEPRLHKQDVVPSIRVAFPQHRESAVSSVEPVIMLRSRLHAAVATVGHVRVRYSFPTGDPLMEVNRLVSLVAEAAERSDGAIMSVCSGALVVGWNAGKPCAHHMARSTRFAWLLLERTARLPHCISLGLATGRVLHGNVGTQKQRFATVLGPCVEIAGALSAAASTLPIFALVASLEGDRVVSAVLKKHVVRIDEWTVGHYSFGVFLLSVEAFADKWGQYSSETTDWSQAERDAVASKDVSTLFRSSDPLLLTLAEMWSTSPSLPIPTTLPIDAEFGVDLSSSLSLSGTPAVLLSPP